MVLASFRLPERWIEMRQTGLPAAALSAVVGPLQQTLTRRERRLLRSKVGRIGARFFRYKVVDRPTHTHTRAHTKVFVLASPPPSLLFICAWCWTQQVIPWALRQGSRPGTEDWMCVYYEREMETRLDDLRARMGVTPFPAAWLP